MKRIRDFFALISRNIYETFLSLILTLNILPLLAPLLAKLGWYWPSKAIYTLYSFFCHQLHWRSIHVCDYQYGWCSRCTFMWFNILLSGIALKIFKMRKIKWYWIVVLIAPMALDGVIQTVATMLGLASFTSITYMSSNFMRMLTGSMFGLGFGLFIFGNLQEIVLLEKGEKHKGKKLSLVWFVIASMLISLLTYILMVFIWDKTSPSYKPLNFLDWGVRTPAQNEEFIDRGKDAL